MASIWRNEKHGRCFIVSSQLLQQELCDDPEHTTSRTGKTVGGRLRNLGFQGSDIIMMSMTFVVVVVVVVSNEHVCLLGQSQLQTPTIC